MSRTISNTDNIIDSRDVIARIEELRDELESAHEEYLEKFEEDYENYKSDFIEEHREDLEEPLDFEEWLEYNQLTRLDFDDWFESEDCEADQDDIDEYKALVALQEECEGYSDWKCGEVLVSEDYFEEYAQDLAGDLYGREISDAKWPFNCIDWSEAAEQLKNDYSCVTFNGTDYYIRG